MRPVKDFAKKLPILRGVVAQLNDLRTQNAQLTNQMTEMQKRINDSAVPSPKIYKPSDQDLKLEYFDTRSIPGGKHKTRVT